jgi:hypothetical protein
MRKYDGRSCPRVHHSDPVDGFDEARGLSGLIRAAKGGGTSDFRPNSRTCAFALAKSPSCSHPRPSKGMNAKERTAKYHKLFCQVSRRVQGSIAGEDRPKPLFSSSTLPLRYRSDEIRRIHGESAGFGVCYHFRCYGSAVVESYRLVW